MYRDDVALLTAFGGASLLMMFFWWVLSAVAVGVVANERKRSFMAWFLVSLVLSPIFATLLLIAAGTPQSVREEPVTLLRRILSAIPSDKADKPRVVTETAWARRAREEREAKRKAKPHTADDLNKYLSTGERPVPRSD